MAYNKHSCSDDGTKVSIPFYSDAHCTHETDMNSANGCTPSFCSWPDHMTFTSGECTNVMHMAGVMDQSWKLTITDCAGDELSKILAGGVFMIFLVFVLPICLCIACCCFYVKKNQQRNAQQAAPLVYGQASQ